MDAEVRERLEHLRAQLRAECISWGELHELQSLAEHIEPGDVELLEAAGVPEFGVDRRDQPAPDGGMKSLDLSPDEASDVLLALSEVIDRHGKFPDDEDELAQVYRWQALAERIEPFGDWEEA